MEFIAEASLIEAISLGEVEAVRTALIEYIRKDPGNVGEILRAKKYAEEFIDGLMDEHNNEVLKPISEWDKEYFLKSLSSLIDNFSEIRFQHICMIGAYLYPESTSKDAIIINNLEPVEKINKKEVAIKIIASAVACITISKILLRNKKHK